MRISTASFYEQSQGAMGALQSKMLRIQQQLASGQKMLAPSDDPLAATRALSLSQSIALNGQYEASRAQARQTLSMEESALQGATTVLQDIKVLMVQAGSGTLTDADRASIATALMGRRDELLGLANSDDGSGQYLFAGFRSSTPPFATDAAGRARYSGDEGQRLMQVDVARQMPAADTGKTLFLSVQAGAQPVTAAAADNQGSGLLSRLSAAAGGSGRLTQDWQISFSNDGQSYVLSTTTPPVASQPPVPFKAGAPILLGDMQIAISGQPAGGDRFTVAQARNAGADVFAAIGDMVAALRTPIDGQQEKAQAALGNALSTGLQKITNAHDNVLTVRSAVGSRLQELDALDLTSASRTLLDKSYLSDLQDMDYAGALSELMQRQTALQASQQSFVKTQQLSLFQLL
jgi:flagellar hook-associated protein 3 FlgL